MSAAKSADASWRGNSQHGMGVLRCEHWLLDKSLIRGLLTGTEKVTATAACKPKLPKSPNGKFEKRRARPDRPATRPTRRRGSVRARHEFRGFPVRRLVARIRSRVGLGPARLK